MKTLLATLAQAFAYFSTIRVPRTYASSAPSPRALSALAVVGAVIGAASGAIGYGVACVSSPLLGDAAAFTSIILLSGGIHLDGFLDSCDALFASTSAQRRLEILKDPRHGTYAVAGMAILTVWWLGALALTKPADLPLRLLLACALARAAAIVPAYMHRYARAVPSSALQQPPSTIFVAISIAVLAALSVLVSLTAWITVPVSIVAAIALAQWIGTRLGGLVGDSYGFMISLLEPICLIGLAARF